jgi:hypothetical protein
MVGPGGCYRQVRLRPPLSLKAASMMGPLGALLTGPAASTTKVKEDVDSGPPWGGTIGGSDSVHHRVLKMTSMAGPLGALLVGSAASTTEVEKDIDDGPPKGRCQRVRQRPPPNFEDDGSRSHPVFKHPTKQSVESNNYACGAQTLGC